MNKKIISDNISDQINNIIKKSKLSFFLEENSYSINEKNLVNLFDGSLLSFSNRVQSRKNFEYPNSWLFISISNKKDEFISIKFHFKELLSLEFLYNINNNKFYLNKEDILTELTISDIIEYVDIEYEKTKNSFFKHIVLVKSECIPSFNVDRNLNCDLKTEEGFTQALKILSIFEY
jgi:hypothetical protein